LRGSSSTTSPRAGSSSTISPTPRVRVPRHVARHVACLVIDYITYTACPGASARRTARRRLLHLAQVRRRLFRLRRASGCLGTSRGSLSTSSPTPHVWVPRHIAQHVARLVAPLVVDYFAYAARPGASARRARRHATRRAACRRLLRLRRASRCLGSSRGLLHRSSSTTSPTPRVCESASRPLSGFW
jgi:hypothetical protein